MTRISLARQLQGFSWFLWLDRLFSNLCYCLQLRNLRFPFNISTWFLYPYYAAQIVCLLALYSPFEYLVILSYSHSLLLHRQRFSLWYLVEVWWWWTHLVVAMNVNYFDLMVKFLLVKWNPAASHPDFGCVALSIAFYQEAYLVFVVVYVLCKNLGFAGCSLHLSPTFCLSYLGWAVGSHSLVYVFHSLHFESLVSFIFQVGNRLGSLWCFHQCLGFFKMAKRVFNFIFHSMFFYCLKLINSFYFGPHGTSLLNQQTWPHQPHALFSPSLHFLQNLLLQQFTLLLILQLNCQPFLLVKSCHLSIS